MAARQAATTRPSKWEHPISSRQEATWSARDGPGAVQHWVPERVARTELAAESGPCGPSRATGPSGLRTGGTRRPRREIDPDRHCAGQGVRRVRQATPCVESMRPRQRDRAARRRTVAFQLASCQATPAQTTRGPIATARVRSCRAASWTSGQRSSGTLPGLRSRPGSAVCTARMSVRSSPSRVSATPIHIATTSSTPSARRNSWSISCRPRRQSP
jgi:hypothetical protein